MNHPLAELSIQLSPYAAPDANELTGLVADAFSTREPLGIALGITHAEFANFLHSFLLSSDVQELTVVARRADNGELVGALLSEDGASDSGETVEAAGEKFAAVGRILGRLDQMGCTEKAPARGRVLHMFMLAVSERAAGMGIGERLVRACMEAAIRKGYRIAVAECTGKTSQHVFHKLGFIERAMIPYADHEFEGKRVFAGIAEYGGAILMEKML